MLSKLPRVWGGRARRVEFRYCGEVASIRVSLLGIAGSAVAEEAVVEPLLPRGDFRLQMRN